MPPDYNDCRPKYSKNVKKIPNNIESLITNNEKGDKKDNNSEDSDQNIRENSIK